MLCRRLSLFLAMSLLLIALPSGNMTAPATAGGSQSAGTLQMQQSQTVTPGGGATYRLRGQYSAGQRVVKLSVLTVRGPEFSVTTQSASEPAQE